MGLAEISIHVIGLSLCGTMLVFACLHCYESVVSLVRKVDLGPGANSAVAPRISVHVPICNEPPMLVLKTLDRLSALQYAVFEVLVVDNNTADESIWRPVQAACEKLGFRFFHLPRCPGAKAEALNFALSITSPEMTHVAVVDADYEVDPYFLEEASLMLESETGFVQFPQDNKYDKNSFYEESLYLAYRYFFDVGQASRAKHGGIIPVGTMCVVNRAALLKVGAWDVASVTEDAELGLRFASMGIRGIFHNKSLGSGYMPTTFSDLRRQRARWAYGGVRCLRRYFMDIMLGPRTGSKMTKMQRIQFLTQALLWFEAFLYVIIPWYIVVVSVCLANGSVPQGAATGYLATLALLEIGNVLIFALGPLRKLEHGISAMVGAFFLFQALCITVSCACIQAMLKIPKHFYRTPKNKVKFERYNALRVVEWLIVLALIIPCSLTFTARLGRSEIFLLTFLSIISAVRLTSPLLLTIRRPSYKSKICAELSMSELDERRR